MTASVNPFLRDQEIVSSGLLEFANDDPINDFIQTKDRKVISEKENEDFANTFICHLIFYAIFCVSLVLYILIDLGLGLFLKNALVTLMGFGNRTEFEKTPVFA